MKRRSILIFLILLAFLSAIYSAGYIYFVIIPQSRAERDSGNPLRGTPEEIREYLLEFTPIGMDMDNVVAVINANEEWEISYVNDTFGYSIDKWGVPSEGSDTPVGEKSIRITVGYYRVFFETAVVAFYGFDENSKLIDVAVRKDTDGL